VRRSVIPTGNFPQAVCPKLQRLATPDLPHIHGRKGLILTSSSLELFGKGLRVVWKTQGQEGLLIGWHFW